MFHKCYTLYENFCVHVSRPKYGIDHFVLLISSCRACVEAYIACGWCVHDRICTGNASICRHEVDWRSLQEVSEHISRDLCLKKTFYVGWRQYECLSNGGYPRPQYLHSPCDCRERITTINHQCSTWGWLNIIHSQQKHAYPVSTTTMCNRVLLLRTTHRVDRSGHEWKLLAIANLCMCCQT